MLSKILVPIDTNDVVRRPLELACDLARLAGGTLVLFAAVDDTFPNPDILSFQLPGIDFHRHLRDEAAARLEKLRHEIPDGQAVEVVVVRGNPARAIVSFAEAEHCDLIVMATHGTTGLAAALVGSVTRRVLHATAVPVLVVRQTA